MCCALSQSSVLDFREVLLKTSGVMEELQSYDEDKNTGLETETENRG
jgi:hypothetical protein